MAGTIEAESTLHLLLRLRGGMPTLTGRTITLDVEAGGTSDRVKAKIQDKEVLRKVLLVLRCLVAVAMLGVAVVVKAVVVSAVAAEPISSDITSFAEVSNLGTAVCILGQLSRLEIDSKIQNMIEPLADFARVDVFLSLESGDHGVFNNPVTADAAGTRCRSSNLDVEGVKEAFAPYFRDGVFGPHVDENITLERWPRLFKHKHPGENASAHAERRIHIANIVSQMRHQKNCAELIQKSEESAGGKYDIVLKVRDNTMALRPVAPDKLVSIREVTLKHCSWWGGVHDKVMALPRKYLEKSLGATYASMLAVMHDDSLEHKLWPMSNLSANTEQVVMHALIGNEVPYRELAFPPVIGYPEGDDYLPFVDGRCYPSKEPGGEGRWCIVSHCKDCWPSMPWTYNVTCEVSVTGQKVPPNGTSKGAYEQRVTDPDPERKCPWGISR